VSATRGARQAPRPTELRVEIRADLPEPAPAVPGAGYRSDAHATLSHRPRLRVRPATRTDTLARSFGLGVAPSTGDRDFDAALWIDHDGPRSELREVLASPDVRAQCVALERVGAEAIRLHHEGIGLAVDLWLAPGSARAPEQLRGALRAVSALSSALPRFSGPVGRRSRVSWIMENAFLPWPLIGFIAAMGSYDVHPVAATTLLAALGLGLAAWLCVVPIAYLVARARTDGGMLFVSTAVPLLVALPALSVVAAIARDTWR
jgi:hypothetical protein